MDGGGSHSRAELRERFRRLHESGCFVMPNPWDVGTARYLRHLGFPALATTSSGFAFTRGLCKGILLLRLQREVVQAAGAKGALRHAMNPAP